MTERNSNLIRTLVLILSVFFIGTAPVYAGTITTPQDVYGVAVGAKSFNLNAKSEDGSLLEYSSSDISIAGVDSNGNIKVGKKRGNAAITITQKDAETGGILSEKTVRIRVSRYSRPNGKIAQSNWNMDKKKGDSKNRDSKVSRYNRNSTYQNWTFIIRCTDPYIANHAASAVTYIVNNKHFGYRVLNPTSQSRVKKRASIYRAVRAVTGSSPSYRRLKKIKKIKKYADTSCTPTVLSGYCLYVDMDSKIRLSWIPPYNKKKYTYQCGAVNVEYHQLEKAVKQINREYRNAGKPEPFRIIYVPQKKRAAWFGKKNMKKHLYRGDIICCCPNYRKGGHTALVL